MPITWIIHEFEKTIKPNLSASWEKYGYLKMNSFSVSKTIYFIISY